MEVEQGHVITQQRLLSLPCHSRVAQMYVLCMSVMFLHVASLFDSPVSLCPWAGLCRLFSWFGWPALRFSAHHVTSRGIVTLPPVLRPLQSFCILTMSPFPPELVERILSNLRQDTQSLASCAVVSWEFFTPAQRLLYQKVHLSTEDTMWPERLSHLVAVLDRVRPCIQDLSLDLQSIAVNLPLFASLMQALVRHPPPLRSIRLRVFGCPVRFDVSWTALFCLPDLEHISLAGFVSVPAALVAPGPHLERLSLYRVGVLGSSPGPDIEYRFSTSRSVTVLGVRLLNAECVQALQAVLQTHRSTIKHLTLFVNLLFVIADPICLCTFQMAFQSPRGRSFTFAQPRRPGAADIPRPSSTPDPGHTSKAAHHPSPRRQWPPE